MGPRLSWTMRTVIWRGGNEKRHGALRRDETKRDEVGGKRLDAGYGRQ